MFANQGSQYLKTINNIQFYEHMKLTHFVNQLLNNFCRILVMVY
jgi:hypothetical protein